MKRQKREEHQNNDQNAEHDRLADFLHRSGDELQPRHGGGRMVREMAVDVFDDDDRSIDDHPDRDRESSERHQIGGQPDLSHDDNCGQGRQDQRPHHDERAADIAKKQKQDDNDQHDPFRQ